MRKYNDPSMNISMFNMEDIVTGSNPGPAPVPGQTQAENAIDAAFAAEGTAATKKMTIDITSY